jgi:putative aldouronate transport system permease protein
MVMILITMYFNGGLVPSYLVLNSLGLVNKFLVFILPHFYSVGTIIVMRTFFTTLPASLEESAKIDGASDIKVFSRIILPLSKPVLATMFLFNAVGHWNDWFAGELFIRDPKLLPLATIMMRILFRSANLFQKATLDASRPLVASPTPEGIRNAAIIVSTIPILLVYPFLQKYFTKGIMIGSIKG